MKKFILMFSLHKTHIKDLLITAQTNYGYSIFKKVGKKWYIGTISYIPQTITQRVSVNIFTHEPTYDFNAFMIEEITIPIDSISFKPLKGIRYYHHKTWGWGYIRKSKVKQMPAL